MQTPINIAFVGLSDHAEEHLLPSVALTPSLRLHTITSRSKAKAEAAACRFRADRYMTDWRAAVASAEVEAVVVTGPPSFHYDVVCTAISCDKHVFVEKPCAKDTNSLQDLITRSEARPKIVTQVGYNFRHSNIFSECMSCAQSFGGPVLTLIEFHSNKPKENYWDYPTVLHSFLYGVGIHAVEMAAWLVGDCTSVTASVRRIGSNLQHISLTVSNSLGQTVQVRTSNTAAAFKFSCHMFSESGAQFMVNSDQPSTISILNGVKGGSVEVRSPPIKHEYKIRQANDDYRGLGYQRQLEIFAQSVRENGARTSTISDSLNTYLLIDTIIDAAGAVCVQ